jgi:mannose-6-phosphate isomerase-like protein (cupin superfamily)
MKAIHTNYDLVKGFQYFEGMTVKVLLSTSETQGTLAVFEDTVAPGFGPPRHIHHNQDETFFFVEGFFDVEVDGQLFHMKAGDVAFIPKGAVHAWKNVGEVTGRLRYVFSPASNIEDMFLEFYKASQHGEFTQEKMMEISRHYPDQENVGPPL